MVDPCAQKNPQKIVSGSPRFWPRGSESHPGPKKGGRFEVAKRSRKGREILGAKTGVVLRSRKGRLKKGGSF